MESIEAMQHVTNPDAYREFVAGAQARARRGTLTPPPTVGEVEEPVAVEPTPDLIRAGGHAGDRPRPRQRVRKPYSTATPERSLAQRMDALGRANEVRTRRAQLKRDLKAGRESVHDVLLEPPEYAGTMKVFDVLLAVPKYGRVKINKVLQLVRVSPSKTVGGLSQRQRVELVSMLRR